MPGMDGFEVLRDIRSDPELGTTPIVFVSVFSGRHELAGEWVVAKPIDADELRDVLGAAVSAGRSRVLVVGREELQPMLEPALDEMGIEHEWELTGAGGRAGLRGAALRGGARRRRHPQPAGGAPGARPPRPPPAPGGHSVLGQRHAGAARDREARDGGRAGGAGRGAPCSRRCGANEKR